MRETYIQSGGRDREEHREMGRRQRERERKRMIVRERG